MPLMVRQRQQRIVPDRSVAAYEARGWARADTPSESEAPAESDRKAAWVDYAVMQGADRGEAEAATKAELVERHG